MGGPARSAGRDCSAARSYTAPKSGRQHKPWLGAKKSTPHDYFRSEERFDPGPGHHIGDMRMPLRRLLDADCCSTTHAFALVCSSLSSYSSSHSLLSPAQPRNAANKPAFHLLSFRGWR